MPSVWETEAVGGPVGLDLFTLSAASPTCACMVVQPSPVVGSLHRCLASLRVSTCVTGRIVWCAFSDRDEPGLVEPCKRESE